MLHLLERLKGVRRSGRGWTARCPAHEDRQPSLSVGRGEDERWLVTCHAGCELDAIVDALGISAADLFPATEGHRKRARREVAVYDYDGEFEVVRYSPKDFRQRRPDGRGGYVWNIQGVKPRLYHLADLAGCDRVVVAEGEKDVDRLRSLSVPATCNAGGAGKWRPEYSEQLKNAGVRHIVVVPDADEQGRKHGEAVARFCAAAGLEVKKVIPPEGAKDISAYLDAGHDRDDLVKLLETAEAAGQETDRRALPGGCLRVSDPGSDATSADVPPAVARLCLACGRDTDTDPCEHCGLHSEQARLVRVTIGDEADERYRGRGGRLFAARTLLEPFRATDGVVYQAAWPNLDPDMQSLVREALPRDFEFELGGADGAASLIWEHEGKAVPPVVIPGLAWARSTTVFEAGPKWGKTSTLCDAIGQSLTNGRWVSQEVEAPAAPVLYYSEMSVNTLRAWLERRCGNARPEVYADRLKGVRGMRVDAQARTPKLIVVDSLIELLVVNGGGRDECKASDIRAVFVQLRSVFGPEPAILIVNHTRKSDGAGRGSGDVRAVADQIVQMADDEGHVAFNPPEKHRRGRILLYRGRWPEPDRFIKFDAGTHGYELLDNSVGTGPRDGGGDDTATRDAIRTFLRDHPGAATRAIVAGVEGRNAEIQRVLADMVETKEVVRKSGRRGAQLHSLGEARSPNASTVSRASHSYTGTRDTVESNDSALTSSTPTEQQQSFLPPTPTHAELRARRLRAEAATASEFAEAKARLDTHLAEQPGDLDADKGGRLIEEKG